MAAIYKREMHSYLTSAVGYVFLAVFFAISGYYFFATSLVSNSTDLSYVFSNLFSIVIFLVPLLTMKLFSEERKQRTEQLLFTAPVRFTGVVLGKFFASLTMYLLGMSVTLVYFLVMCAFRVPDVAIFVGNFLGLLLLGAALCAIGIFISSLTESQVIAAVGSLAIGMFLLFANSFTPVVSNQLLNKVMDAISFYDHYLSFTRGLIHLSDLTFFISVTVLFLFLTVRHLERRRIS
ncbi:MAG: ABC transporter permease subunit [Negativibacillus sp.]|nr:ABC transporter permease subunit [Negativibacillus sp.]